jgi:glycosyltransferase involved in cell wall biosynthesis
MFLGWRPDVENIYAASDVVVLTSDNEGMPVTLIEAAAAGVPAVTTGVGSAPEVVVDGLTGFVTDRTTRGLADAVDGLLADPELRSRMGRAAAARAEREFGADRLAASMQALYEGIIVAGARAGRRQAPRLGRFRRH